LIAASHEASNRLISIEDLTDEELDALKKFYTHLAQLAKKERNVFTTHSIDEAKRRNSLKNIESESAIIKIKK
jgi:low affinity Fe/Cu permease